MTCLPIVGTIEVDVEFLASPESISLGKTHYHLRTHSTVGLALEVCLYIEVVWLVEDAAQRKVESIA